MECAELQSLSKKSEDDVRQFFEKWNKKMEKSKNFSDVDYFARQEFAKIVGKFQSSPRTSAVLIESIRLMSRDKAGIEGLMTDELCDTVLHYALLPPKQEYKGFLNSTIEAQKCLINTLFNSSKMRDRLAFYPENSDNLLKYLRDFEENQRQESNEEWIKNLTIEQNAEVWYLYHRVAFIVTALIKPIQRNWSTREETLPTLLLPVEALLDTTKQLTEMDKNRANEALKTIFNIYCHSEDNCMDMKYVEHANVVLRKILICEQIDDEIKQSAVNCFALPPIVPQIHILCDKSLDNMTFTQSLLDLLERKLDELPKDVHSVPTTSADLIGPNFSALSRLCKDSKYARRYCRMKVLPPLKNTDIEKRPEEQDTLRGKIVRLMMTPTCAKDIASQFIFILCKKSVGRMIKYTGFGHSAGLLANMGLLGQINDPKRESDSEDSETDEYKSVRDNVNPVTGSLFEPDRGSAIANMSDEQKEYEAMKLLDAMNKMMDAGVVKPGTIGEDGKVREVSHVLELAKNVQLNDDNNSDFEDS